LHYHILNFNIDVNNQLRECEVRRLRLELQIANITSILEQKRNLIEAQQHSIMDNDNRTHPENTLDIPDSLEHNSTRKPRQSLIPRKIPENQQSRNGELPSNLSSVMYPIHPEVLHDSTRSINKSYHTQDAYKYSDLPHVDKSLGVNRAIVNQSTMGGYTSASSPYEIDILETGIEMKVSDLEARILKSQMLAKEVLRREYDENDPDTTDQLDNKVDASTCASEDEIRSAVNLLNREYQNISPNYRDVSLLGSEELVIMQQSSTLGENTLANDESSMQDMERTQLLLRKSEINDTKSQHLFVRTHTPDEQQGDELIEYCPPNMVDKKIGTTTVEMYTKHGHKMKSRFGDSLVDDFFEAKKQNIKSSTMLKKPSNLTGEHTSDTSSNGFAHHATDESYAEDMALSIDDLQDASTSPAKSRHMGSERKGMLNNKGAELLTKSLSNIDSDSKHGNGTTAVSDSFTVDELWQIVHQQQKEINNIKLLYAQGAQSQNSGVTPVPMKRNTDNAEASLRKFVGHDQNRSRSPSPQPRSKPMEARSVSPIPIAAFGRTLPSHERTKLSSNSVIDSGSSRKSVSNDSSSVYVQRSPDQVGRDKLHGSARRSSDSQDEDNLRSPLAKPPLSSSKWVGGGSDFSGATIEKMSQSPVYTSSSKLQSKSQLSERSYSDSPRLSRNSSPQSVSSVKSSSDGRISDSGEEDIDTRKSSYRSTQNRRIGSGSKNMSRLRVDGSGEGKSRVVANSSSSDYYSAIINRKQTAPKTDKKVQRPSFVYLSDDSYGEHSSGDTTDDGDTTDAKKGENTTHYNYNVHSNGSGKRQLSLSGELPVLKTELQRRLEV
jgi:hypothetical protein